MEIESGDRLTPEEFEMIYGPEGAVTPEETSERLRIEFGSALSETQGIADMEPEQKGATYTKSGDVCVVEDGRGAYGQYATIKWSEREGGFDVQIYEKFKYFDYDLGEYVADASHTWGSYMLEGKVYENDRSDYGATADGRITTVEGLEKALNQFDIPCPDGMSNEILPEITRGELRMVADLAEAQGVADMEPKQAEAIDPQSASEKEQEEAVIEARFDDRPTFEAAGPRLPFIEDALAAGATVDHISVRHHGGDWTLVSFANAEGTYLVKGEDVYVTPASVEEAQAAIESDPAALPGIGDLKPAGDIEIEAPDVSLSQVVDSMGPNNRAILERALADGAVVSRFWAERNEGDPGRYAVAVVSFEDAPGTYIFWNSEDGAQNTQLDFGATRYALDFGYDIGDLKSVSAITAEENRVEPRGRVVEPSLSM